MADYFFDCSCGRRIEVTASQAGAEASCTCGARPIVPRLSQLRRSAGQAEYDSGAIDVIRRLIDSGELPRGETCAVTGVPTSDIVEFSVECERTWHRGPGRLARTSSILAVLLLPLWPIWALVAWDVHSKKKEELGRDRTIRVPLRIEAAAAQQLCRRDNQRELRRLMRTVPEYAALLEEFPNARIMVLADHQRT